MNKKIKNENLGRLLRNLPQETLGEDFDKKFWEKFDRRTPPAPRAGLRLPALAGVSLGLAACAVLFFAVDKPQAILTQGEVSIHRGILGIGSVETGPSGWAILEVAKGYRLKVQPSTKVEVKSLKPAWRPGKTVFYLSKGQALVSIGDEIHRKYPLEILTANAFARAMGTQFSVSAPTLNSPSSKISVLRGVVRVGAVYPDAAAVSPIDVAQGFETQVKNQQAMTPQKIVEDAKNELEEFFQFSKPNRAILLISMGPSRVRELLRPCGIYIRFQVKSPATAELENISRQMMAAQNQSNLAGHPELVQALERAALQQTEVDPIPLTLFVGAYYHYLKDDSNALRVFDALAKKYPSSRYASLAVMAQGVIYQDFLHDFAAAQQAAQQILSQWPDSPEVSAAAPLLKS